MSLTSVRTRWSLLLFALLWSTTLVFLLPRAHAQDAGAPTSYGVLADLLENPESRAQLILELRRLSARDSDAPGDQAATPQAPAAALPLVQRKPGASLQGNRLAWRLQRLAETLQDDVTRTAHLVHQLLLGERVPGISMQRALPALKGLALALLIVVLAWNVLQRIGRRLLQALERWAQEPSTAGGTAAGRTQRASLRQLAARGHGRKLLAVMLGFCMDLFMIVLSALAGYAGVVLAAFDGPMATLTATQYLTAFVVVEALKTVSRALFCPTYAGLRLLPIPTDAARFWHRWLAHILMITGYTLLLVVPMLQALMTPALGHVVGLLVMTAVYLYALRVVWTRRHMVRRALDHEADRASGAMTGTLLRILARTWHWLVMAYFSVLYVVSQADSQEALSFMGRATAQTLIAILAGVSLFTMVSNLVARRIRLPADWRKSLPSLESRVNAYIPAFLRGVRLLVSIVAALVVLDAWHAFNLADWLGSSQAQALIGTLIHVAIILFAAALTWTILTSMIEHRIGKSGGPQGPTEREKTLLMLFRSGAAVTIVTLTALVVLSQIGIDIGPLIAGAGVAGLAIGFGAQKLVQDVITGIFIQLDNGMNQNDVVEVAGLFGTVEKISIRSVVLRTMDGGYHLIPFSTIDKLANHTRDYGYHYGEYRVAHRENVEDVTRQLRAAFEALRQDPELAPAILDDIAIPGVTSLDERGFTLRVLIKTTPGMQWAVQRGFNRRVKECFDAAGIEIPYPQTVLHFGRDRDGHAAPLDVRHIGKIEDSLLARGAPGQTARPIQAGHSPETPT